MTTVAFTYLLLVYFSFKNNHPTPHVLDYVVLHRFYTFRRFHAYYINVLNYFSSFTLHCCFAVYTFHCKDVFVLKFGQITREKLLRPSLVIVFNF